MATWTLLDIRNKIEKDLATEDELFVQKTEFSGYVNEAIREAEAEIHKLGLDDNYYLSKSTISLVNGTAEYSLPSDIYANKIKNMFYLNGAIRYKILRLRGTKALNYFHDLNYLATGTEEYRYLILNDASSGPKIVFSPTPKETVSDVITIWYVRDAKELSNDSDVCDIPEFINFILQYVKNRVYEKDVGHPNAPKAASDLEQQRALMIATLTDMVADGDNVVEQDISFYEEST
jgi:hypothetical protein